MDGPKDSWRRGFTIIELLVVISIIALLVSLLLPTMKTARELARTVQCASTQRQAGVVIDAYANDYKDFPWTAAQASNGVGQQMVDAGYTNTLKAWTCSGEIPYIPGTFNDTGATKNGEFFYIGPNYSPTAPGSFLNGATFFGGLFYANQYLCSKTGYKWNDLPLNQVPTYSTYVGPNTVVRLSVKTPQCGLIQLCCPDALYFGESLFSDGGTVGAYYFQRASHPVPSNYGDYAPMHNGRTAANVLLQNRSVRTISYAPGDYYQRIAANTMWTWIMQ